MRHSNAWHQGLGSGDLVIHKMKHGFKVKIWGQPSNHLMDWNGCNYRIATVEGQPLRGFKTFKDAEKFARTKFKDQEAVDVYAQTRVGLGTWLKDSVIKECTDVRFK